MRYISAHEILKTRVDTLCNVRMREHRNRPTKFDSVFRVQFFGRRPKNCRESRERTTTPPKFRLFGNTESRLPVVAAECRSLCPTGFANTFIDNSKPNMRTLKRASPGPRCSPTLTCSTTCRYFDVSQRVHRYPRTPSENSCTVSWLYLRGNLLRVSAPSKTHPQTPSRHGRHVYNL